MEAARAYAEATYRNSIGLLFEPGHYLSLFSLAAALLIAALVLVRRAPTADEPQGLIARLFPRRVFLHPSAKLDYALFLVNEGALFFVTTSAVISVPWVAQSVLQLFNSSTPNDAPNWVARLGYTALMVLAWDFAATYAHYLKHRIPILWEFHKVHHSAEVLTPITALRRHPLEDVFGAIVTSLVMGLATAAWILATQQGVGVVTIFSTLAGVWIWRLLGYNLRHSHVWISYGPFWSRVFISPAQHQVHHSDQPAHYDKNFGHIFALWDMMFGTLYVPARNEKVTLGIDAAEMGDYRSVSQALITPFRKSLRRLRKDG